MLKESTVLHLVGDLHFFVELKRILKIKNPESLTQPLGVPDLGSGRSKRKQVAAVRAIKDCFFSFREMNLGLLSAADSELRAHRAVSKFSIIGFNTYSYYRQSQSSINTFKLLSYPLILFTMCISDARKAPFKRESFRFTSLG